MTPGQLATIRSWAEHHDDDLDAWYCQAGRHVHALLAEVDALTAERDTAVERLDAGVRDLARARGVHPDVIRVAMGLHNPTGLCDTEPPLHVVGGRPA